MKLDNLRYLLEIERCQSFNKAAQNLFVSHSTLSYLVQNLEDDIGYPIFFRTKRGVVPTQRGLAVLNDCRLILDLVAHWRSPEDTAKTIKGHVQITSIPILARMLGLDILVQLREAYPDLTIHFDEKIMFSLDSLLHSIGKTTSRIFIASLGDPERAVFDYRFKDDDQWDYYWSDSDVLALHLSSQHPLSQRKILYPEELAQLPLLFYPASDGQFGYSRILRYFTATQPYNISTAEQVLDMVERNLSTSLSSRMATFQSHAVQTGAVRCVPIHGFPMPMNYCLLYPSKIHITPSERVVVDCLIQRLKAMDKEEFYT